MNAVAGQMPTELHYLGWSVILLLVHIALQGTFSTVGTGVIYNLTPRDDERQPSNIYAGRFKRALANFLETYPAFVALALALAMTGKTGGWGATGAVVWFWARVVYVPLYGVGVPLVRTLVWVASAVGLVMMLIQFLS